MNIPIIEKKRFNFQNYVSKNPWKKGDMCFEHFMNLEKINSRYNNMTVIINHKDKKQVFVYSDSRVINPTKKEKGILKIRKVIQKNLVIKQEKGIMKFRKIIRKNLVSRSIFPEIKVLLENLAINSYENYLSQKPVVLQFMR